MILVLFSLYMFLYCHFSRVVIITSVELVEALTIFLLNLVSFFTSIVAFYIFQNGNNNISHLTCSSAV